MGRFVPLLVWLAAGVCWAGEVTRTDDTHWSGRRYSAAEGECRVELLLFTSGVNRGTLKNFSACPAPWMVRRELLRFVLHAIREESPDSSLPGNLYWGSIAEGDSEAACRLAQAAAASPRWDARKGKARSGNDNLTVRALVQEAEVYRELGEVLGAEGYRLTVGGVEKVRVFEGRRLGCSGLKEGGKYPFDALIGFRIEALEKGK